MTMTLFQIQIQVEYLRGWRKSQRKYQIKAGHHGQARQIQQIILQQMAT